MTATAIPAFGTSAADLARRLPPELVRNPQWVAWRREERDGRETKIPYSPVTNLRASSTDPATWSPFEQAFAYAQKRRLDGLGYVFSGTDQLVGIDLDHCVDPLTGAPEAWALEIVARLYSYTEISPSGTGLHLFVCGTLPAGRRKRGQVETYESGRYFTITGRRLPVAPATINECPEALAAFYAEFLADPVPAPSQNGHTPEIAPGAPFTDAGPVCLSDAELLERAFASTHGVEIQRLYDGSWEGVYSSQSEADLALCNYLAYWTNRDVARVDRLFRQSRLMRPKWDRRIGAERYGEATITRAIAGKIAGYAPAVPISLAELGFDEPAPNGATLPPPQMRATPVQVKAHRTDLGNAKWLIARHGADLHYCYELNRWLIWNGVRWTEDHSGSVERRAKETIKAIWKEAELEPDPKEAAKLQVHAIVSEGIGRIKAMVDLAKSEPGISVVAEALDADPWLLNCQNGTVDLCTGQLRPHHRADLIAKLVPIDFDLTTPAPRWERFLAQVLPSPDVRQFVQCAAGYSATGLARDRVVLLLYGVGRNGKSVLLNVLRAALGDYALVTRPETFMAKPDGAIPNDVARLKGARLVSASETQDGRAIDEAAIKHMTGNEPISARFLHAEFFEFSPQYTPWLATNHKPTIRGTDAAIWDRVRLIPFGTRFWVAPEQGPPELEANLTLEDELRDELPGILAWIVQGALLWQTIGLPTPPEVIAAVDAYRAEMDVVQAFLDDCCVLDPNERVTAKELYAEYAKWAKDSGEKVYSQRWLGPRLREHGLDSTRDKYGRYWLGVGIRPPSP